MNHGEILRRQGKMIEALNRMTIMEAESPKAKSFNPAMGCNVMGAMMTYKATAHDTGGCAASRRLAFTRTPSGGRSDVRSGRRI
jgi:hypothetical protein